MTDLTLILIVSVVGTLITVYACEHIKDYHKHYTEFADRRRFFFAMLDNKIDIHTMRDITRGGLGTVPNELGGRRAVTTLFGEGLPRIC